MVVLSDVLPPITLLGLTMAAVNEPAPAAEPPVICSHVALATAVHAVPRPLKVTVTFCGAVTFVIAPAAPAFVAPNFSVEGVDTMSPPKTVSVADALVALPNPLPA